MKFWPFEVSIPHIVYAALGAFVVFFGMFSLFIRERVYIGEACLAFVFGVVIGPYGVNIFDPRSWGNGDRDTINTITLEVTRVVLAIGVFAIGVELPKAYMQRHWKSLLFLLAPVMTYGWFVSAALIYALIPGLNFLSSLAIAACLTPTDPILAAAVVGGKYADKHVPAHLRHLLAAESGCNDGAAYPFLWIALYLTLDKSTGRAISDWFLLLWLYQVILGIVFGACIGFGFRHLMRFCERNDLIDRQSYVAQYISLAALTIGSCTLLGTDDLLAAFSCGAAFAWDGFFNKQTEESVFSSVIDLLFNIAAFVFVGAWVPFHTFADETLSLSVWRLIVIGILVMILRRLPIMIALYRWIPDVKSLREAIFSGHFGPMGVGAIFISTLAAEQLPAPASPPENQQQLLAATIQPIVAFMVVCSILIHGLSIPFFSLGRRVHSVTRTWSRHDTLGRTHGLPEWANLTRPVVHGHDIVINRDDRDVERGEATMFGEDTPEEKASTDSQQMQDEEARRETGEDMRDENPPDGEQTETITEWKEGPHKIVEKRAGPGEEVEVEVHRNAYAPADTTVHTARVTEDRARDAIHELRHKLSTTLSPPKVVEGARHEVDKVENAVENAVNEVSEALAPSGSQPSQPSQDEEEGWMSDREDQAESSAHARAKSKSPRPKAPKPPKLAMLRPTVGARRRTSIRRGMLGARTFSRAQHDYPPTPGSGTMTPPILQTDEDFERGRSAASTLVNNSDAGSPSSSASASSPWPSFGRSGPRHARVDSLLAIDPRASRRLREASPARSVRWADEPDTEYTHGRSSRPGTPRGWRSPASPATPLPGSEAASENENDSEEQGERGGNGHHSHTNSQGGDSPWSATQVRFSIPDPSPGSGRS
ncbi:hypothetical protein EIP86_002446 [Pleurotus ostreatoroseus]|nr:hypothetical protein EIP86_002446 [Pleurotus ostreatoroseus]